MKKILILLVSFMGCILTNVDSTMANVPDRKYEVKCEVGSSIGGKGVGLPCQCSLFSYYNFEVVGSVGMLPERCDLCDVVPSSGCSAKENHVNVGAVLRGGCSFDTKAITALKLGYHALIIVNTNPNEDAFPMGSNNHEFSSKIPVVMMHHTSQEYLSSSSSTALMIEMVLDHANPPNVYHGGEEKRVQLLDKILEYWPLPSILETFGPAILVCLVLLLSTPFKLQWLDSKSRNHLLVFLLSAVFLATRLGTFRKMEGGSAHGDSYASLHHMETDERIFADLVQNIEKHFFDYSLISSGTVSKLGLAIDNYGDKVFIHPPFFVYLLYALKTFLGSSLPLSILLMHIATLFLVRQITMLMSLRFGAHLPHARSAALLSMTIFSSCPLAAFCSQKVWIDNALMFACTVCAYTHLCIWMPDASSFLSPSQSVSITMDNTNTNNDMKNANQRMSFKEVAKVAKYAKSTSMSNPAEDSKWNQNGLFRRLGICLFSGMLAGFVVLNCKVTGIALMPFLGISMMYSLFVVETPVAGVLERGYPSKSRARGMFTPETVKTVILPVLFFSLGLIVAHGPWVFYYYSITGRILPNAWPSPTLIARNVFLKRAVNQPASYYVATLLKLSPIMLVGILAALVRPFVVRYKHKKARIGFRGEARHAWWLAILSLWPVTFLLMLTILGILGAGYQARFMVPIIPATSVLTALHLSKVTIPSGIDHSLDNPGSPGKTSSNGIDVNKTVSSGRQGSYIEAETIVKNTIMAFLLCYAALHMTYYTILATHLHADLDVTIFDMISTALNNKYKSITSDQSGQDLLNFLRHMGFPLRK